MTINKQPCRWPECDNVGTQFVRVNVPAAGMPIHAHEPAWILIDVCLCERHLPMVDAHDLLDRNPKLRAYFSNGIGPERDAPADLEAAFVTGVAVGSPLHIEAVVREAQREKERVGSCAH
jgi:hypothetical protein